MRAILVPFKEPARGKKRLASILSPDARAGLSWAMLHDMVETISTCLSDQRDRRVKGFIVSSVEALRNLELAPGWEILQEMDQVSESASVDRASRILCDRGFTSVLRIPSDLPLVRSEDLEQLLDWTPIEPAALLVPSRDGTGTNALFRYPPDVFPARFGPDSFRLHQREAARAGVCCETLCIPRMGFDVDEPSDLLELVACKTTGHTGRWVQQWNCSKR